MTDLAAPRSPDRSADRAERLATFPVATAAIADEVQQQHRERGKESQP